MPGLLRGIARTAVVAGTATRVANRVSHRQSNRWARQGEGDDAEQAGPARAAPAATATRPDPLEQLRQLGDLRDRGILTDAEFAAQKTKILGS